MESTETWGAGFLEKLGNYSRAGIDHLPEFLGAILILIVGWLIARALRRATQSVSQASNRFLRRLFPTGALADARMSPFATSIAAEIVFWSVFLLALTMALHVAGFSAISQWFVSVATYLPHVFASIAIVVAGYILGIFVREQFVTQSKGAAVQRQTTLMGRVAQGIVVTVAIVMALDQLGIAVLLPTGLLLIAAAALAITLGVSVALGARSYMSNVVGMRSIQGQLFDGLDVRVNGVAGRVLELTNCHIILETDDGKVIIPGQYVSDSVTAILAPTNKSSSNDNDA